MRKVFSAGYLIVLVLTAAIMLGAGGPTAPQSTPELQKIIGFGNKNTIVFFENPNGIPCREQNRIIQKLIKEKNNDFNVAYISTMKAEDQKAFYDYGVRSLPTVVLVDSKGSIAKVFPPGIQSLHTLSAALDAIKQ